MACIWVISGVCVVQHMGHNVSKHRMKRDVQYENEKSNYGPVEDQWIPRWKPLANGVIFTRTIFRWLISCRWHIMSNMLNDTHARYRSNTCHAYPLTEATLICSQVARARHIGWRPLQWPSVYLTWKSNGATAGYETWAMCSPCEWNCPCQIWRWSVHSNIIRRRLSRIDVFPSAILGSEYLQVAPQLFCSSKTMFRHSVKWPALCWNWYQRTMYSPSNTTRCIPRCWTWYRHWWCLALHAIAPSQVN